MFTNVEDATKFLKNYGNPILGRESEYVDDHSINLVKQSIDYFFKSLDTLTNNVDKATIDFANNLIFLNNFHKNQG